MLRLLCILCFMPSILGLASPDKTKVDIQPGAHRLSVYLPLLKGKKVGIFANQTTTIGKSHLVDSLHHLGVDIRFIFAPEHGFRGNADAGEKVGNSVDSATGIPIISLYGSKRQPSIEELNQIDILVFDIQDVGVRFYTYISSLEQFMNAAIENAKPLLILDRPNPNGFYVDGPVLEKPFKSFIGMQPIPVVYGLTIGEYAQMLMGEGWLSEKANKNHAYFKFTKPTVDTPFHVLVIKCANYTHKSYYEVPVAPSPNLPTMQSILLYPSTCFFEGTDLSLGRGTPTPFQMAGHPSLPTNLFSFTPQSVSGAKNPPQLGKTCYGFDWRNENVAITNPANKQIKLSYLINAYAIFQDKNNFFLAPKKGNPAQEDYFFNKLAGNSQLMWQIMNYQTEEAIRKSWEPGLKAFKIMRKKYLLYKDF